MFTKIKKVIKGIMVTTMLISFVGFTPSTPIVETVTKTVYICNGPYSKRYHLKDDCRGLSNCSTDVFGVSIEKAKEIGRTICGWED